MRVASYNIRKAVGLDGNRNPGRVLAVINQLEADIVVLQEADLRFGQRASALPFGMIEEHSDYQIANLAPNEVSMGWHGNAVLYRDSVDVTRSARLSLPGLEPRGSVLVNFVYGDKSVSIIGVHLGLVRHWRRRQLQTIMQKPGNSDPARTLILGDFNEWSDSKGLEPIEDAFSILAPGNSFHAARPIMALDKIAYGSDVAVKDAGVDQSALARKASDHLPIWADLEL